ncbi:MAG: single-stranded-DNA-specific exonuclease RecJ, partial [Bacteroidota bacterium]
RKDCSYPFKELSGCGIGFKLIQAFVQKAGKQPGILKKYLGLVAVSIGADIVPITGENRILTYMGIQQLNTSPCNGLYSIMKIAGIDQKEINVEDIVFRIGPRINAAGRMKSGRSAVELLVSDNQDLAEQIGKEIDACNSHRKDVDRQITEEALTLINSSNDLINAKSTVVYNEQWHKGVVGIVASRLIESFYRPTVVLTKSNGMVTGSGRSIFGFDLYNAIHECSGLLENYGGHYHAAGLSLKENNVPAFREKFEEIASAQLTNEMLIPRQEIDAEIEIAEITPKLYRILRQFEPCGPGNMTPVFCSRNVVDRGTAKPVGKNGDHLKLNIYQNESSKGIPAIAFRQGHHYETIKNNSCFDICYTIDLNHFNGKSTLQLNIKDIKIDFNARTH